MTRSLKHGWVAALACGAIAFASASALGQSQGQFRYGYVDLGTLGGPFSRAVAMSDNGMVTGWADRSAREGDYHAFLWRSGPMQDLGTLGGWSEGRGINNAGDVVGRSIAENGEMHAFIYTDGVMHDLNDLMWFPVAPPGSNNECSAPLRVLVEANAINDAGVIVACGYAWADDEVHGYLIHPAPGLGREARLGYYYMDLGRLERAFDCLATDVNGFDQVVGISGGHAFAWDEGRIERLDWSADASRANAINESGAVAGWSLVGPWRQAALWSPRGERELLETWDGWESKAFGVNDHGVVVGWLRDAVAPLALPPAATVWDGEEVINLNNVTAIPLLPDLTPWVHLEEAADIDEAGRIVGYSRLSSGYERAYLLIPIQLD